MKYKKRSNTMSLFSGISNFRKYLGLFSGLIYAFCFYAFLITIREIFQISSITHINDIWIIPDEQITFYNFIFALIALIFGQSVSFSIWFDRPHKVFKRKIFTRSQIINDQSNLNWVFLSWFSKLAIVIWIFYCLTFPAGFYTISIYPDYNFVFIILIIVLFLNTWLTLRRKLRKSFKIMILSAGLISIAAYGLSRINIIDYKTINNQISENKITKKYNLSLPVSNNYFDENEYYLQERVYVVRKKGSKEMPIILYDGEEIPVEEIGKNIYKQIQKYDPSDRYRVAVELYIHSDIQMGLINELRKKIWKYTVNTVYCAVVQKDQVYPKDYYIVNSKFVRLPSYLNLLDSTEDKVTYPIRSLPAPVRDKIDTSDLLIRYKIPQKESNNFKENMNYVYNQIKSHSDYTIILEYNAETPFSNYLKHRIAICSGIDSLRNQYANKIFSCDIDALSNIDREQIIQKYPQRVFELAEE